MKKLSLPLLAIIFVLTSGFISIKSLQQLTLKDDYSVAFKSDDPSGEFTKMKANISFNESDLSKSSFEITIDVNSISTGNGMKNKKAMTAEWFDQMKYPTIYFKSTKVEKIGSDYQVVGNLKIKGITKTKTIPLKVEKKSDGFKFSGKFSVNRIDYKVGKVSDVVPNNMNITYVFNTTK